MEGVQWTKNTAQSLWLLTVLSRLLENKNDLDLDPTKGTSNDQQGAWVCAWFRFLPTSRSANSGKSWTRLWKHRLQYEAYESCESWLLRSETWPALKKELHSESASSDGRFCIVSLSSIWQSLGSICPGLGWFDFDLDGNWHFGGEMHTAPNCRSVLSHNARCQQSPKESRITSYVVISEDAKVC